MGPTNVPSPIYAPPTQMEDTKMASCSTNSANTTDEKEKKLTMNVKTCFDDATAMKNDSGGRPVACKGTMWTPRLPTAANIAFHFQHNHRHAASGNTEYKHCQRHNIPRN